MIGNRLQSWHLELWQRAPTPQAAVELHANTIRAILKRHRIRRLDAKQVRQMLRSKPLPLDPVAAEGNAEHVDSLAQRLQLVERQIGEIETKLERHIAEFSEVPHPEDTDAALEDPQRPNDTQILRSMPGIGMTVASVLLSEAHDVLARRDYESLRCLSGVAPVTRQSGKSRVVRRRRAADRRLSDALYHWARTRSSGIRSAAPNTPLAEPAGTRTAALCVPSQTGCFMSSVPCCATPRSISHRPTRNRPRQHHDERFQ